MTQFPNATDLIAAMDILADIEASRGGRREADALLRESDELRPFREQRLTKYNAALRTPDRGTITKYIKRQRSIDDVMKVTEDQQRDSQQSFGVNMDCVLRWAV
jgi:hypothetical protein